MNKHSNPDWIPWVHDKPPAKGTVVRLKFQHGGTSNPITIVDGRGLNWGRHEYTWARGKMSYAASWRIVAYQILKEGK